MKHQKLLSGLILTGLLLLVCLTGSAAAASASITPNIGAMSDSYTLSIDDVSGTNYQWYVSSDAGTTWNPIEGAADTTYTFTPANEGWSAGYPSVFRFRVDYSYDGRAETAEVAEDMYFYNDLTPSANPVNQILGGEIALTAIDTGYSSILWEVSKDGGEYTTVGTGAPEIFEAIEKGTYKFRATAYYADGYTQTKDVSGNVKVSEPVVIVSPSRGDTTTRVTLTAGNLFGYTDFRWQVSTDNGSTFVDLGTENPLRYIPGEEGEYLYRVILSGESLPDYTATAEKSFAVIGGLLPETAPISTAAFYAAAVFLILLFMAGLWFVYNDNVFGFIASGFAVLCSWALMALSAFGRVGDTHVFYSETTGATVTQILHIDPAMVFIITFACIVLTVVFIVILVRFIAQLAILRNQDPEEEEEE